MKPNSLQSKTLRPHHMASNPNKDDEKCTPNTSHASDTVSQVQCPNTREKPEWEMRLEKFVVSFVSVTEKTFDLYQMLLEDRKTGEQDSSSVAKDIGKGVGTTVGNILSYVFTLPGGVAGIVSNVCAAGGGKLGDMIHKNKLNNLSDLIYYYQENKEAQRKILVEAGIQIFTSFEEQIMGFEGKTAWQTYIYTFSVDAAHRVIKFCSKEGVGKFTIDVVTKGVIKGISKKQKPQILMKRGLEIAFKQENVTTKDIFTDVGLLNPRNDNYYIKVDKESNYDYCMSLSCELGSMNDNYYVIKEKESNVSRYGYRILFNWELDHHGGIDKDYAQEYQKQLKPPENMYKYVFKMENYSKILKELLTLISPKEMYTNDGTTKQDLQDLKEDIVDEITEKLNEISSGPAKNELLKLRESVAELKLEDYATQLQLLLKDKYEKMQETLEKESNRTRHHISTHHEETRAFLQKDAAERDDAMLRAILEEFKLTRMIFQGTTNMQTGNGAELSGITLDFRSHVASFSGRVEDMKKLHSLLHADNSNGQVVVYGLGGVGKSELARKYAAENCIKYNNNVVWVNAESFDSMYNSFLRLAQKIGVITQEICHDKEVKVDICDIATSIYDKMRNKCLFVFDDVQKCRNENKPGEDMKTFLPDGIIRKPHVIITSCLVDWDASVSKINLNIFEEKETLELLKTLLGNESNEYEMREIGELLGHLPLALQIASSYINGQGINIRMFIDEFNQKKVDILKLGFPDSSMDNSTKTIFTTFQVILEKIPGKFDSVTSTILSCLAYLNPAEIPVDLFSDLSEDRVRSVFMSLKKFSVITNKTNREIIQIHKLVQYVIRRSLEDTEEMVLEKVLRLLKSKLDIETTDLIVKQAEDIWHYAGNYKELIKQYYTILEFPLHQAVKLRRLEMVKCLIEDVDIDIYSKDRHGLTALYRANQHGNNIEIVKYLILKSPQHEYTEHPEDWKILGKAAEENKEEILKFLIDESYADRDLDKNMLLCLAAQKGRLDVVAFLLNNGTSVTFQRNGVTLLHEAAYSNNKLVVKYVLVHVGKKLKSRADAHAYINAKDMSGDTALMWAAKSWKRNAVQVLLDHGAAIGVKNSAGKTALQLAEQTAEGRENQEEFLSLLR